MAGCSDLKSHSLEATPVDLPPEEQETFRLTETVKEPFMKSQEATGGVEVLITVHAAVYSRAVGIGGQ